ncbi:MAG: YkgJ family cysteine cluster protein [Actinomycetota bacterium]|nr:YkgJ family cysteine cluster protein [Actinomycetota bacterium]
MNNRDRPLLSVRVTVAASGESLDAVVAVPADPADPAALVPVLQELADALMAEAVAAVDREGLGITCRSGCPACCFQPVPVTEPEARFLVELVGSLPEDQKESVRSRVRETVSALETENLDRTFEQIDRLTQQELEALAARYHRMRMPCPFLSKGMCSIYEQRPLACREYLVTSPAEHCEWLGELPVVRVRPRVSLFTHLTRDSRIPWMLLPYALGHADRAHVPDELLPGPEQLARLLGCDEAHASQHGTVAD